MAFKNNIPLATDKLSNSQSDLLDNFAAIDTYVNVDHTAFNAADQGHHKYVFFSQYSANPVTAATEAALFTKAGTDGNAQLFYAPHTSAAPVEISYALKGTTGWTWLPSGIRLYWTTFTSAAALSTVFTFPAGFSFTNFNFATFATPITVATGAAQDTDFGITTLTKTGFTMLRKPGLFGTQFDFRVLAIGD